MQCEYCGRNNFRNKEDCVSCGGLLPIVQPIIEQSRYRKHMSKTRVVYGGSGVTYEGYVGGGGAGGSGIIVIGRGGY